MSGPDRVYAIGDVHGQLDLLLDAHARIERDLAASPVTEYVIVHIGDYVDRGPDSAGVLARLVAGADAGEPWINLMGNHDRMFFRYLIAPGGRDHQLDPELWWLHERIGGLDTLRSYGLTLPDGATAERGVALHRAAREVVPARHLAFLAGLRRYWFWREWFFVHAGVRPGVALSAQDEDDLIWIRDEFLSSAADHGAVVVHGHTPVEAVEDHGNRIAIDTGAGYGGPLSCLVIDGGSGGVRVLGGPILR
ncbi:metallophosphoesterase [Pikeienuella sp. HZG-20]|uniref:metallophosphoesterase n=1 Tax=Paludibacillus litoralis TaxID=3133267 RepID=UPI0030EC99D9